MTKFAVGLKKVGSQTVTTNGAKAYSTTSDSLLDLFASIGSMRNRTDDIRPMFNEAFQQDKLMALKLAFHARNIRGGLGERDTFREIIRYLGNKYPQIVINNFHNILNFGRADDLFALFDTNVENEMMHYVREILRNDVTNMKAKQSVSLMAKWMPSENASSKKTKELARRFIRFMELTPRKYRIVLSRLRKYINVLERLMSAKKWEVIDYSKVPSQAMRKYRKAFSKRDSNRFGQFLAKVEKGEVQIKAGTLTPFDIFKSWVKHFDIGDAKRTKVPKSLQLQWNALPNFVGNGKSALVMADTSGSMAGDNMAVAVSLAIYFAERATGPFKNTFMTFSERPSIVQLTGETLQDKMKCVPEIVSNTDLEAAFKLILDVAIKNKCSNKDLPEALVVISDMQFDSATTRNSKNWSFQSEMKKKFKDAGYKMPTVVYWNVGDNKNSFQSHGKHEGVQYASGKAPSVFRDICNAIGMNAQEMMLQVLNSEMYKSITL